MYKLQRDAQEYSRASRWPCHHMIELVYSSSVSAAVCLCSVFYLHTLRIITPVSHDHIPSNLRMSELLESNLRIGTRGSISRDSFAVGRFRPGDHENLELMSSILIYMRLQIAPCPLGRIPRNSGLELYDILR